MKSITTGNAERRSPKKRTHTLKSILERQQANAALNSSLFTIEDDLIEPTIPDEQHGLPEEKVAIDHVQVVQFGNTQINDQGASTLAQSIDIFTQLIDKEVTKAAQQLELDQEELQAWIDLQVEVPAKTILQLLRTMQDLHLDPLQDDIGFTQYEDGNWQVYITVDGCSKVLNQHNQFNGLVFAQSDALIDGVPEWMECSIYRKDRIMPITVREYFVEVKAEQAIWQKMPRRMLRHRVLQQCVRLAMF